MSSFGAITSLMKQIYYYMLSSRLARSSLGLREWKHKKNVSMLLIASTSTWKCLITYSLNPRFNLAKRVQPN